RENGERRVRRRPVPCPTGPQQPFEAASSWDIGVSAQTSWSGAEFNAALAPWFFPGKALLVPNEQDIQIVGTAAASSLCGGLCAGGWRRGRGLWSAFGADEHNAVVL